MTLGMLRLPSHIRSLIHTRCLIQRSYSNAVHSTTEHYDELNKLFNTLAINHGSNQSKKQKTSKLSSFPKAETVRSPIVKSSTATVNSKKSKTLPLQSTKKIKATSKRKQLSPKRSVENELGFTPVTVTRKVIAQERNAVIQIYNYAAAALLIPEFYVEILKPTVSRRAKKYIRVTIKLPEHGIETSAVATSYREAQAAAAIDFKRQAEQYRSQLANDDGKPPIAMPLTIDTGSEFFKYLQWYEKQRPVVDIQFAAQTVTMGDSFNSAYLTIDQEPVGGTLTSLTKNEAEKMAWLVAAVHVAKKDPMIIHKYQEALKEGKGTILQPVPVMDLNVDPDILRVMRNALHEAERIGLPQLAEAPKSTESRELGYRSTKRTLTPSQLEYISKNLSIDLENFSRDPNLETLRTRKKALPMNQYRNDVLKMINENIYSIVVGATGSGKTTQVPQILLDDAIMSGTGATCNIVCTQPRRIAATSVAQRVADERNEKLCRTVGYHVRFDKKTAEPIGSINYCTTGILLEQLKHNPDDVFNSVSHLVIDEVHERDLQIDFLMIILKKAIRARKAVGKSVPRVVLMSATLDTEMFARYFHQSTTPGVITPCPSISVPGRTFPVKEKFLGDIMKEMQSAYGSRLDDMLTRDRKCTEYLDSENAFSASNRSSSFGIEGKESAINWNRQRSTFQDTDSIGAHSAADQHIESLVPVPLVAATLAHICNTSSDGAILTFFPGLEEITKTNEMLRRNVLGVDFKDTDKFKICILHSSISKEDQADVFRPVPLGCRKIILATNIAETSVTIPDVQYVVDTGKLREKRYDQSRRITSLQCTWVSKSNSKQRAGRAGRVQNGNYYALFTRERYELLRTIGLPELLRSDLQETCLDIKAQSFDDTIADFLAQSIEPPAPQAVNAAVENLISMEALTRNQELTSLGKLLAKLPVHPTLGKMIVLGVIFRCLDPLLILGAAADERPLFMMPAGRRIHAQAAQNIYNDSQSSDHISMLNAFKEIRTIRETQGIDRAWRRAEDRFIHMGAFRNIDATAQQLEAILSEVGLIPYISKRERQDFQYGHHSLNTNSDNYALIKALLYAGYSPNLAVRKSPAGASFRTATESLTMLHQSSINKTIEKQRSDWNSPPLLTFGSLTKADDSNTLFMRNTTLTDPMACILFGGQLLLSGTNKLELDGWLPFYVKSRVRGDPNLILYFKSTMDLILRSSFHSLLDLESQDHETYMVNDKLRELFTHHLINILSMSTNPPSTSEESFQRLERRSAQSPRISQNSNQPWTSPYSSGADRRPLVSLGRAASTYSDVRSDFSRTQSSPMNRDPNANTTQMNTRGAEARSPQPPNLGAGAIWWRESNAHMTTPGAPEKVANRWVVKQLAGLASGGVRG